MQRKLVPLVVIHGVSAHRPKLWYTPIVTAFEKATGQIAVPFPVTWETKADALYKSLNIQEGSIADVLLNITTCTSPDVVQAALNRYWEASEIASEGHHRPVVIGHSAGSVLAYKLLTKPEGVLGTKARALITLGSPLWIARGTKTARFVRFIMRLAQGVFAVEPDLMPYCDQWLNVAGLRDPIAAFGLLRPGPCHAHYLTLSRHNLDWYASSTGFGRACVSAMS